MAKRSKMSRSKSRRAFTRGSRINKRNLSSPVMRGGIRL